MAYKTLGASSTTLFTAQFSPPATRRLLRRFNVHSASIILAEFPWGFSTQFLYHIPLAYRQEKMSHLEKEKQKLIARIKRIRGQVDSIERSLTTDDDCADVLMLLANVRGGINSLMAEVLEDHIRLHMLSDEKSSMPTAELAEDLIGLVRAYLK
jgi:DNA-binding FrmR family transcriptional regulator